MTPIGSYLSLDDYRMPRSQREGRFGHIDLEASEPVSSVWRDWLGNVLGLAAIIGAVLLFYVVM